MKKFFTEDLVKILISLVLFVISLFLEMSIFRIILLILSYVIVSYEIYIEAFKNICKGEVFDEDFLMIVATIGAFIIGEFSEGVMVILLFQIGEYLSDVAVNSSRESITKLLDLRSDYANLVVDGDVLKTDIKDVKLNDEFIVKVGEKVPLDGIVIDGDSFVDTSSLTGESVPVHVDVDSNVLSGYVNNSSPITVRARSTYETSTASKIISLIENSNEKKSDTEDFIRKFCKVYTPIVVLMAIFLVVVPSIITGDINTWLYRGLVFLVTSCPCALVISVPLGYFCGIGRASRDGILIKGSRELDKLRNISYVLFDKTGTITKGVFEVNEFKSVDKSVSDKKILEVAAVAEEFSIHPIAISIKDKFGKKSKLKGSNYKEISGMGISCIIDEKSVLVGNSKLFIDNNIDVSLVDSIGSVIYVSIDNKYVGYLVISDTIKDSSYQLTKLKNIGINDLVVVSGDNKTQVEEVCKRVGIDTYYSDLLPIDKVNIVKKYKKKGLSMFVGDGINDAPVIKISDVGVSMGSLGSDAAIEASDVVLMHDDLGKIEKTIKISRVCKKMITVSIVFALSVKFLVLMLGVFGISTIWMAVFADVGVTILSVLNVLRIMWKKI